MDLQSKLRSSFTPKVRKRGDAYFQDDRVIEIRMNSETILASVEGKMDDYGIRIDLINLGSMDCTCLHFSEGNNCKHIWSVILRYDWIQNEQSKKGPRTAADASAPGWKNLLNNLEPSTPFSAQPPTPGSNEEHEQEIIYIIDPDAIEMQEFKLLRIETLPRRRNAKGEWTKPTSFKLAHQSQASLTNPLDRKIASMLIGVDHGVPYLDAAMGRMNFFELSPEWPVELLETLVETGRFYRKSFFGKATGDWVPINDIQWDLPYAITMQIVDIKKPKDASEIQVVISQQKRRIPDQEVILLADNGVGLTSNGLFKLRNPGAIEFWAFASSQEAIQILKDERVGFLKHLSESPGIPSINLPKSWGVKTPKQCQPRGRLKLKQHPWNDHQLTAEVYFVYGGDTEYAGNDPRTSSFDEQENRWLERDAILESKLVQPLLQFPLVDSSQERFSEWDFRFHKKNLMAIVEELNQHAWEIILQGTPIRKPSEFDIAVSSGQDWFDLSAEVHFEGQSIPLPSLLEALANKENFITLADGSRGCLPTALLEKYAKFATFGTVEDDKIRFRPTQAMLLDSLLDAHQNVTMDRAFATYRRKLKSFSGIKPKSPPRGFKGDLREYQKEGLGWLHFLREYQLGGCLADDMGLGKTVQVLALLESRRNRKQTADDSPATLVNLPSHTKTASKKSARSKKKNEPSAIAVAATECTRKPSIVIVPKSLIFNWIEEAAKFAPKLRILNYTGTDRKTRTRKSTGFDILLTTYGTARKDIDELLQVQFDYAILDESQAIKNSKAQVAKACRLLVADYRLAMTGTPIENHLGELWSLFEFLNPGMLGASKNFAQLTRQKKSDDANRKDTLMAISKAIRPFVLRRTKEQVLTDLPAKTEQTLYCDMVPSQKKKYKELKEYYRVKLAKKIETDGIKQSKIQVLEALLRLRQVACDPRLLDKKEKAGAKLELLEQQIHDVIHEGHKVLIFSQFTSLLSLVKEQFDEAEITYEYLDGQTSNRQRCVKRFQSDPNVSAFLISLKAGGHGLNLTAADYVFLLDPWWNPAVEAQAIDRAHRMGQTRPVIAYRMICRGTVEEKIVKLQESKRELADSIIRADESIMRSLTVEDLQTLLM